VALGQRGDQIRRRHRQSAWEVEFPAEAEVLAQVEVSTQVEAY